jgi:RNase P/RNase MRP subunit p29
MKSKKLLGWVGLIILFVLMFLTAVAFLLASSRPDEWEPYQLRNEDQRVIANRFATRMINELVNGLRDIKPFSFTIHEEEMNEYLASLDEIAFLTYSQDEVARKSSELVAAMDKVGIADPVVDMRPDTLTLMVRTKKGNKIISLDLVFEFTDDEQMYVKLDGVRLGLLPLPQGFVSGSLEKVQGAIGGGGGELNESSVKDMDRIVGGLISGIGGEPLPTRLPIVESRPKRIRDIEIDEQKLTIHFVPAVEEE